jgi:MFS transporter, putative metabolite:H+ symporter
MSTTEAIVGRAERLPVTGLHRRIMIILGFGTFFDAFDTLAIASALTVIFSSLHIDFIATGMLIGAGYVGQLIGALLFGVLSEVWGRKKSFIVALSVMGLFSIGSALAWNLQSLALSRALLGIGLGGEAPIAGTMIVELLQRHRRGRYFLIYQTLYQWGILLTPVAGFLLISALGPEAGWRVLFAVGAAPLLLALVSFWWLPESVRWLVDKGRIREAESIVARFEESAATTGLALGQPAMTAPPDTKATKFAELFHPNYLRRTALCWLHWFLCYYVVVGLVTWLPGLFVRVGHLSVADGLLATVGVNVVTVIMGYVSAWLIDRLGRKILFSVGFVGMAVGALIGFAEIAWLDVQGWIPLFTAACVMQAFLIFNAMGCYLYTAELYPTRMRGWGSSTGRAVSLIASIIAPITVGAMLASSFGAAGMFALFAIASLLGLAVILWLGVETKDMLLEELSR